MAKRKSFDIIGEIAEALHTTVNKILKYRTEVQAGFKSYHKTTLESIPLSKDEAKEILSILDKANQIDAKGAELTEYTVGLLEGTYKITSDNKLIKTQNLFEILPFLNFQKEVYKMQVIQAKITPKFIKDLTKENNWTYKDLAENIGAVETTVRNWMSKGEIPEWAKKSISYIATIKELEQQRSYQKSELDELKGAVRTLLDSIKDDELDI